MDCQPSPIVIYETASSNDWHATAAGAKSALISQFVSGNRLQVGIQHRALDSVLDENMFNYLSGELHRIFGCNFVAQYNVDLDVFLVTAVGIPELQDPQLILDLSFGAECFSLKNPMNKNLEKSAVNAVGYKKPPRPMNCWMLFRDDRHKKLKAENPDLTVQQISTICSNDWKTLPDKEKKVWHDEARKAKAAHQLLYPDYKYNPRKPGQKKKRQSRKTAKVMASSSTKVSTQEPSATHPLPDMFDFNSFSGGFMFPAEDAILNDAASTTKNATFDANTFLGDPVQSPEAIRLETPVSQDPTLADDIYYAESCRQARLEAEFGGMFHAVMNGDEGLAFRAGADEDATLPEFFSGHF